MIDVIKNWFQRYLSHPEAVSLLFTLIFAAIAVFVLGNILVPIMASVIIAYMLNGFVVRMEKWKMPHFLSFLIAYLFFIAVFLVLFVWLLPLLFQQLASFIKEVPIMFNKGQNFIVSLQANHPDIFSAEQLQRAIAQFNTYMTNLGQLMLSYSISSINNVITIIIYVILVPLLVFFFLKDRKRIGHWCYLPPFPRWLWAFSFSLLACRYLLKRVCGRIMPARCSHLWS